MNETKMNRQLGTKWFTFYAKVRPWPVCFTALSLLVDFFQYIDLYFSFWWMFLYFASGITQSVLAIIVFIKSKGDYEDFVRFVKGVLIFEISNMAYQQAVLQYIEDFEIGTAIMIALIILVVGYFLWYRLNIKYFERRILKETPDAVDLGFGSTSSPNQDSDPNTPSNTYGAHEMDGNDVECQSVNEITDPNNSYSVLTKAQFCRKCGSKLPEEALFCTKCGTKVIAEEQQGE